VTRFALLFSLLALGALALVACDDDDETATAETEVITSDFGQDLPGSGPTAIAGGPNACRDWRRGPGDIIVEINALKGVIRCREAQRVLKNYYRDPGSNTRPWSCEDYGEALVQCMKPGGAAFNGTLSCKAPAPGRRPVCPGF
jgi:hypothetical protein